MSYDSKKKMSKNIAEQMNAARLKNHQEIAGLLAKYVRADKLSLNIYLTMMAALDLNPDPNVVNEVEAKVARVKVAK